MKFAYTILYVDDVRETLKFYENAFEFAQKFITPENDYGELLSGETTISFASSELANSFLTEGFVKSKRDNKPFGVQFAFTTEDVKKSLNIALAAGAILVAKPVEKPWGQIVSYVKDINGFLIEICSPITS